MEGFVKAFIKASLVWLSLGIALGVAMAAYPPWTVYRPVHLHMLVLGFVAMMIFGVAYHVMPRFSGHVLHGRRYVIWHWWLSNIGLLTLSAGFVLRVHIGARATPVLTAGGVLAALGAWLFAYLIWRTIDGPRAQRPPTKRSTLRTLDPG